MRFSLPEDAATAASAAARMIAETFAAACEALASVGGGARGAAAATTFRMSVIGELELVGCSSSRREVPSRIAASHGGGERAASTSKLVSEPTSAASVVGLGVASGPGVGPVDPLSPLWRTMAAAAAIERDGDGWVSGKRARA